MSLDETLTALKAQAYERGVAAVAKEAEMSDDTLRSILSDNPPGWLRKYRRLEEIARAASPSTQGEAPSGR